MFQSVKSELSVDVSGNVAHCDPTLSTITLQELCNRILSMEAAITSTLQNTTPTSANTYRHPEEEVFVKH